MIERLTEATLDSILESGDLEVLRALLRQGFPGFERMATARLIREMELHGLLDCEESADPDHTAPSPAPEDAGSRDQAGMA